jgi:D-glycero-alpha-D-manno-heptose 1-phosphate guanylyltransferase
MQAVILAGGLGTRLRGVVPDLPKPMAPINGRPFLAWILDQLNDAGFDRAVLAVGYRHEIIRNYFGDRYGDLSLAYSVEDAPLGTGGAIRLAADQITSLPVFVLNGDTYLELDYQAMWTAHQNTQACMSMAVYTVADVSRYGALDIDDGVVCGFLEKGRGGHGLINAGAYILATEILERIPTGEPFSFEQQLLVPMVKEIRPVVFFTDGLFIDIGVPDDYDRVQQLLAAGASELCVRPCLTRYP